MNKNMKITTKLTIGFVIIGLLVIALLYASYTTAATIIGLPQAEQAGYLSSYATFTSVIFVGMVVVISGISIVMTRTIRLSLKELQAAASAMA